METGFGPRHYRERLAPAHLASFTVRVKETDLWIAAEKDLAAEAEESVRRHRRGLEEHIARHPAFAASLVPVPVAPGAPPLVAAMAGAAKAAGVGPMAAVAGAIAEAVARDLAGHSAEVVVENGGDLYLMGGERTVAVWAGLSPFTGKLALRLLPGKGLSVCTSSATVGPSLSLGRADAALVISRSGALADAAATFLGNRLRTSDDIEPALASVFSIAGVTGALAFIGGKMGVKGKVKLVACG